MSSENDRSSRGSNNEEMQLTRIQQVITGAKSKAANMKQEQKPISKQKLRRNQKTHSSMILARLLQMPMDILIEVSSHLSPLDLIHLARSTKELRDVLMSRNCRPIWRAVLRELGAPDCPEDINEPQFISLVFEKFCQGCGAPRVKKVDYGLRIRLCPGCYSLNVVQGLKLIPMIPGLSSNDFDIYRLCYFENASLHVRLGRALPNMLYARQKYFIPDFREVVRQYRSFGNGTEELKDFESRRLQLVKKTIDHVIAIEDWLENNGTKTGSEASFKALARKTSILARLREMDYSDEDLTDDGLTRQDIRDATSGYSYWRWNQLLLQPRELTEKIWQRILPELQSIIVERRSIRLTKSRQYRWDQVRTFFATFRTDWELQNGKAPLLSFGDLKRLADVKSLVENARVDSPVTAVQWQDIKDQLSIAVRELEARVEAVCSSLITSGRIAAGLPPLAPDFATEHPAHVLAHASSFIHPQSGPILGIMSFQDYTVALRSHASVCECSNAQPRIFWRDPKLLKIACALLRCLSFSDSVSMAEMDSLGEVFLCNRCRFGGHATFDWKSLVEHFRYQADAVEIVVSLTSNGIERQINTRHDIDLPSDLATFIDSTD